MSPALIRYQDGFEHRGAVAREKAAGHRIAASEGGRGRAHRMKRGMSSLVRDSGLRHISMRPSTTGTLSRLACTRAVSAGIDVEPLMLKAAVTRKQVEDQAFGSRRKVRSNLSNWLQTHCTMIFSDFILHATLIFARSGYSIMC